MWYGVVRLVVDWFPLVWCGGVGAAGVGLWCGGWCGVVAVAWWCPVDPCVGGLTSGVVYAVVWACVCGEVPSLTPGRLLYK